MARLLGLSGALRAGSFNTKLIHEAARVFAPDSFALGDLRLPLYDGDLEDGQGIPATVQALADQIAAADAVVIATPEYNKSLSGVLKNALDWVSRTKGAPWKNKPVAIMTVGGGPQAGARGNAALRLAMTPFRPRLLTGEVLVASGNDAFDDDGRLTRDWDRKALQSLMDDLRDATGAA